jgi:hypothetical protein
MEYGKQLLKKIFLILKMKENKMDFESKSVKLCDDYYEKKNNTKTKGDFWL